MTLPTPISKRASALLVPFPLGALVCQRRQREPKWVHPLVHHACKLICRAGQAHPDKQHVLFGVLATSVQPRQHGDRDIGGRRRAPRSFRRVRSSMYGWSTSRTRPRPASTDTGPLARSARSLAVISSPNSCSFSTTRSVDVISSASAASSGSRTTRPAGQNTRHQTAVVSRGAPHHHVTWPAGGGRAPRKSRRCPLGRS